MTIYRGYTIERAQNGAFQWQDETGNTHTGFADTDSAMDAIDAHKRTLRETN